MSTVVPNGVAMVDLAQTENPSKRDTATPCAMRPAAPRRPGLSKELNACFVVMDSPQKHSPILKSVRL